MEIKQVHTPCKSCVFALWEQKTQKDCKLGRLDRFRKQGGEDAVVEVYDTEEEFFVISGRLCNAHRPSEWAAEHKTDSESILQVREELKLKLSVLVILEEGKTEEEVLTTAESLKAQSLLPVEVLFVNHQKFIKPGRLNALLFNSLGNTLTWRIVTVLEPDAPWPRVLDLAVEQVKSGTYYAVFRAGFVVPAEFVQNINEALNERLERFSLLTPLEDGNGLVVQVGLHRHPLVGGNEPILVEEGGQEIELTGVAAKVIHMAHASDQPHMVKSIADFLKQ